MMALRKVKALVVILALVVVFGGAFSIITTDIATAAKCCWVMVCTVDPPVICWEECRPCPGPPPPWP
jgi:hypothetical protein